MSNRDDKLDAFLKKNAPRAPAPPVDEKQRIQRAIEAAEAPAFSWRDWLALPQLRIALPALAALAIVDRAILVSHPPAAIGKVRGLQPAVGATRGLRFAGNHQPHRRLDVIPRIGVRTRKPGNTTIVLLGSENEVHARLQEICREQALAEIQLAHRAGAFRKYITTLLPSTGFNSRSSERVIQGLHMRSHTSSRW